MKRQAKARRNTLPAGIYQLKITLEGSKPPIWRRVQVPATVKLTRLHDVIQVAMGWTDSHLHQFFAGDVCYRIPHPDDFQLPGEETGDERKCALCEIAPVEKARFLYEYDFGDGWEHDVLVEKILPPGQEAAGAVCLAGKNACPPDDSGGIGGYYNMLEILKTPRHPDYEMYRDWLDKDFDPSRFEVEKINAVLRGLRV
jgi:hypothetical protein